MARRSEPSLVAWALVAGVVLFLAWVFAADPRPSGDEGLVTTADAPRDGGSAVPCQAPLAWRVAEVDPRFGVSTAEARWAVEAAARLWHEGVGRTLFSHHPADGLPIGFVYDERQAAAVEGAELRHELELLDAWIDARRVELDHYRDQLARDVARYNATVDEWNRQGGAPEDVVRTLQAAEAEIIAREEELAAEADELNRQVEERNRAHEILAREFPEREVESGQYREQVERRLGRVVGVSEREIRIYRFVDREDLVTVIAHELGHALGLGHVSTPDAVMSQVHHGPVSRLHAEDRALLAAICPELADSR